MSKPSNNRSITWRIKGKAFCIRVVVISSLTASKYFSPNRPPCLASHSFWERSSKRTRSDSWQPLASINFRTAHRHWAQVSRTGATTASETKSPNRSNARTHKSLIATSSSQIWWYSDIYDRQNKVVGYTNLSTQILKLSEDMVGTSSMYFN